MTEQRVWALYCVAGLSYREITELTGWKWSDLKYGIQKKWHLARTDDRQFDTEAAIRTGLAEAFGFNAYLQPISAFSSEEVNLILSRVSQFVAESREAVQKHLERGEVDWNALDGLDMKGAISLLACCFQNEADRDSKNHNS